MASRRCRPIFPHFPYANPDAPKGGRIDYAWPGSFDSLNPFIVQGDAARGMFDGTFGNNVFDTLMVRSRDEAFTLYPLIAQSIDTDADRTYVEFTLDPRAKFSDGTPITPGRRDLFASSCCATRAGRSTSAGSTWSPRWRRSASTACG